jgi:hypothetical protein
MFNKSLNFKMMMKEIIKIMKIMKINKILILMMIEKNFFFFSKNKYVKKDILEFI